MDQFILTLVFTILLIIIIIVGNGFVIIAIMVEKSLPKNKYMFIFSLAIADLLVGLLIMPLSLTHEIYKTWFFGNFTCKLYLSLDVLFCTASIYHIGLISLERYFMIRQPIKYIKYESMRLKMFCIFFIWIFSIIISIPSVLGWSIPNEIDNHFHVVCVLNESKSYVAYSTLLSFFIPAIIVIFLYIQIIISIIKRNNRIIESHKSIKIKPNGILKLNPIYNVLVCKTSSLLIHVNVNSVYDSIVMPSDDGITKNFSDENNIKAYNSVIHLKKRLRKKNEKKSIMILGTLMIAFFVCWFPFFVTYFIQSIFNVKFTSDFIFKV
ncbi:hypothetical protein A3Q56_01925 [Intoshia linei]|uniref:G-protein coupled receptors family 1 profile domain-containing protein n=1 Tax=Intoshia linei TaxID=1819745 RepID=A0A177B9G8_9BILA|nr:hypothetical protein A3Q56_01925 [Intoshia linei]